MNHKPLMVIDGSTLLRRPLVGGMEWGYIATFSSPYLLSVSSLSSKVSTIMHKIHLITNSGKEEKIALVNTCHNPVTIAHCSYSYHILHVTDLFWCYYIVFSSRTFQN